MASALFAVAVSGLMLLSPVSASTTNAVIITHPYTHVGASIQISNSYAGCGKYTVQKAPKWHAKTGDFEVSASANASGCQSPGEGAIAQWYSYLDLDIPLSGLTSRAYTVNETWNLNMMDQWALTPYTHCKLQYSAVVSECLVTADVQLYTYTIFEDLNNYSETFSFISSINDYATVENYSQLSCTSTGCVPTGGNYTFGGNASGSNTYATNIYNNFTTGTLNGTHSYEAYVVFLAEVDVETVREHAKTTGSASAAAKFNMGSGGNLARLQALRIA